MAAPSEEEILRRKIFMEDLEGFINTSESSLKAILEKVGWNSIEDSVALPSPSYVKCPLDEGHSVPKEKLQQHLEKCSWTKEGYVQDDIPLPSSGYFNIKTPGFKSVTIDGKQQALLLAQRQSTSNAAQTDSQQVPKTANRIFSQFSREERLYLYDHVIEKTKVDAERNSQLWNNFSASTSIDQNKTEAETYLAKLAAERDAKRRRMNYKGKKVHTNRKSQVEIMKEVIESQMQMLFGTNDTEEISAQPQQEREAEDDNTQEKWQQQYEKKYDAHPSHYNRHSSKYDRHYSQSDRNSNQYDRHSSQQWYPPADSLKNYKRYSDSGHHKKSDDASFRKDFNGHGESKHHRHKRNHHGNRKDYYRKDDK